MVGRVQGMKAVVTGSGGAMGGTIAVRLAQEGADVALNDRRPDSTAPYRDQILALGRDTITVDGNVTRRVDAAVLIDAALERWGRIDILVNVVGGLRGKVVNPLWEISEEDWEFALGINLRGTFHCTQLVLPTMMQRRCGKIVNIASVGWAGEAAHTHYSVAKAGVVAFTRSAATQLGPYNINVNAVAPGGTRRAADIEAGLHTDEVMVMSVSGPGPLGRINEPADIANTVLFLCSDEARNISGELITVNGGSNHRL
jgi:NAD(P)-dependent dehydrogenase (short-subunit alcohol dehydrogenase family)